MHGSRPLAGTKGEAMEFAGKTALVTGSGAIGGLGHATARVLAGESLR